MFPKLNNFLGSGFVPVRERGLYIIYQIFFKKSCYRSIATDVYIICLGSCFFKGHKKKYFDEVEAQTWNHQTVFCIVYLTKIQARNFF